MKKRLFERELAKEARRLLAEIADTSQHEGFDNPALRRLVEDIGRRYDRCTSDITLRDQEHRLVRCVKFGPHEVHRGKGVMWTGR